MHVCLQAYVWMSGLCDPVICLCHLGPWPHARCGPVAPPRSMHGPSPGSAPSGPAWDLCSDSPNLRGTSWGGVGPPQSCIPVLPGMSQGGDETVSEVLENLGVSQPPVQPTLPGHAAGGWRSSSLVPRVPVVSGQMVACSGGPTGQALRVREGVLEKGHRLNQKVFPIGRKAQRPGQVTTL